MQACRAGLRRLSFLPPVCACASQKQPGDSHERPPVTLSVSPVLDASVALSFPSTLEPHQYLTQSVFASQAWVQASHRLWRLRGAPLAETLENTGDSRPVADAVRVIWLLMFKQHPGVSRGGKGGRWRKGSSSELPVHVLSKSHVLSGQSGIMTLAGRDGGPRSFHSSVQAPWHQEKPSQEVVMKHMCAQGASASTLVFTFRAVYRAGSVQIPYYLMV